MLCSKESCRTAAFKGANARVDRPAAPAIDVPPRRERIRRSRGRRSTLDNGEEEAGDKRHGEDDAKDAGEREKQQSQRDDKEWRHLFLEGNERMGDELRAWIDERKRRAVGEIKGNALDAEAQWCNRMDELYAREAAVP